MDWDERLRTGIPEIDEHHQKFFRNFSLLLEAARDKQQSKYALREFLEFLQVYIDEHFYAEELLMYQMQYPDTAAHLREHSEFKVHFLGLYTRYKYEGSSSRIVIETCIFATGWLADHIQNRDRVLAEFVEKKKREQSLG